MKGRFFVLRGLALKPALYDWGSEKLFGNECVSRFSRMDPVIQIGDGIARVDGLKDAMAGELLEFVGSNGQTVYGMAQNLEEDEVGAVLLGDVTAIKETTR